MIVKVHAWDPGTSRSGFADLVLDTETNEIIILNCETIHHKTVIEFTRLANQIAPIPDDLNYLVIERWVQFTQVATGTDVGEIIGQLKVRYAETPISEIVMQVARMRKDCEKPFKVKSNYSHDPDDLSALKHGLSFLLKWFELVPDKVTLYCLDSNKKVPRWIPGVLILNGY